MSVYVDDSRVYIGNAVCCYMFADTPAELHQMAGKIKLGKWAYQKGEHLAHYNVCMTKRAQAIKLGAIEVDGEWRRARIRESQEKRSA